MNNTQSTHQNRKSDNGTAALIERLSVQSVRKHFDAYADIDWEAPSFAIDPNDVRWELPEWDTLGGCEWYGKQPAARRRRIGLHLHVARMRIGWEFENILQRGLLTIIASLSAESPEFRYAHHEIIEESQHTLMFREFVRRAGLAVPEIPLALRLGKLPVMVSANFFPALFFLYVLSGEEPIDHVQRKLLHCESQHPLLRRVCRIHVTEEARHVCFAHSYLRKQVPALPAIQKWNLIIQAPVILKTTADLMLGVPSELIRIYEIPPAVTRTACDSRRHQTLIRESLEGVRNLCAELGILTSVSRRAWHLLGIA